MMREIPEKAYWSQENLGVCFLACLKRLRESVEAGDIQHFLVPGLNLLAEFTDKSRERILAGLAEEKVLDMVYNAAWFGLLKYCDLD